MYNDIADFHVISPTALMMNDLHLSLYTTKKGSGDVKYFLVKKCQQWSPLKVECSFKMLVTTCFLMAKNEVRDIGCTTYSLYIYLKSLYILKGKRDNNQQNLKRV